MWKDHWHEISFDDDPINHDVQELNLPEKDYDFVILNQTFEHLVDISGAVKSVKDHLVTGGCFYANWPIINIRHMEPLHFFTGITQTYINYLLLYYGFEILECGTWGNRSYVNHIFEHQTWPDYTQIDVTNDLNVPCIGWILAKK